MRFVAALLLLLPAGCEWGRTTGDGAPRVLFTDQALPEVAADLVEMDTDSSDRRAALLAATEPDPQALRDLIRLEQTHAARLREIVARYGWPGRALVGPAASQAAWRILQKAEWQPGLQAELLARVTDQVASGEIPAEEYAQLTDRVRVARGQPQVYGTQFRILQRGAERYLQPSTPIENPDGLDLRRAGLGLPPHADYLMQVQARLAGGGDDDFVETAPSVSE